MMALAPAELRRLVGVLNLLGSAQAGERDAAALAAHRLVAGRGLDWKELLLPAAPGTAPVEPASPSDWQADLLIALSHPGELRSWERDFCTNVRSRRTVSGKQRAVLAEIAQRLRSRERS